MSTEQGKIWGITKAVLVQPFTELHHIKVKPHSYCSKHIHKFKSNLFYCLSGAMIIKVWEDGGMIDETVLTKGKAVSVPPGKPHRFETPKLYDIQQLDPDFKEGDMVEVLELYYPEPINPMDIVREDTGGSLYTV